MERMKSSQKSPSWETSRWRRLSSGGPSRVAKTNPFAIDQVREDLRSIFALGSFTDVQVDIKSTPKGKEVIFIVVEKPSIKDIVIRGNQKIKLEDIKEKMTLVTRSIFNLEKVKENAELIRRLYFSKGYYGVKVEDKVEPLETNEVVVTFQITEGPKGRIKKITFKGNKHLKSADLKRVMQTKEWTLLSYLTKTGILDEDILKNDVQLLTCVLYRPRLSRMQRSQSPRSICAIPNGSGSRSTSRKGLSIRIGTIDFKGDLLTTKEDLFKTLHHQTKRCLSEFRGPKRCQCPHREVCQPGLCLCGDQSGPLQSMPRA